MLENTQDIDDGCTILDALKALKKYHYIEESIYPYIIDNFAKFPPVQIYTAAYKNPSIQEYRSVPQDPYHVKYVLSVYK